MLQTIQGYFQEGRFVSSQQDTVPDYVEVYVVVTNKPVPTPENKTQNQRKAFENFIYTMETSEPLGREFDESIKQGIKIRGGFKP